MDEHVDRVHEVVGPGDEAPLRRVDPREERLTALRRTYCRELVREGRLDWDAFGIGPEDVGSGVATVLPSVGQFPELMSGARLRRWRPRRSRR